MDAKPVAAFCAALSLIGNLPPKPAEAATLLANNVACGPLCHSEDRPEQAANIRLEAAHDSVVVNNTPLKFNDSLASGQISTVSLVDGFTGEATIQSVGLNLSVPYDVARDPRKFAAFLTSVCPTLREHLPSDEWRIEWRGISTISVSCPDAFEPGSSQATEQLGRPNHGNIVIGQHLVDGTDAVLNREFPMDVANPVALDQPMSLVQETLLPPDVLRSYGGKEGAIRRVLDLRYDNPKPTELNKDAAALLSNFTLTVTIRPATKAPSIFSREREPLWAP